MKSACKGELKPVQHVWSYRRLARSRKVSGSATFSGLWVGPAYDMLQHS